MPFPRRRLKIPKIRFSHDYAKLPALANGCNYLLTEVIKIDRKELLDNFVAYDTKVRGKNEYYELPKGLLLILGFVRNTDEIVEPIFYAEGRSIKVLYTTVRRWTPRKEEYYRSLVGKKLEVVIDEQWIKWSRELSEKEKLSVERIAR